MNWKVIKYQLKLPQLDMWSAYNVLSKSIEYTHQIVNHNYNFVSPTTGAAAHTQATENLWRDAKAKKNKKLNETEKKHDWVLPSGILVSYILQK